MNQDAPRPKSATGLVSDVLTHVASLLRKEIDLARAEMSENLNRAGIAIGLLAGAIVVALVALNVLAGALVGALTLLGLEPGWSALLVGVIFAAIAAAMVAKGIKDLKLVSLAPTRTAKNVRRDADAVRESI